MNVTAPLPRPDDSLDVVAHGGTEPRRDGRTLLLALVAVGAILTGASYLSLVLGGAWAQPGAEGHRLLNVGAEANIPTWWTSMLLALGAAGLVARGRAPQTARDSRGRWPWFIVGGLLAAMSLDELASIHELLTEPARNLTAGSVAFAWLILGIPLALGALALAVVAGRRLPQATRRLVLSGLLVFFLGAIVLEGVGSALASADLYATRMGVAVYHLEEFLEMAGAAVLAASPTCTRVRKAIPTLRPGRTVH